MASEPLVDARARTSRPAAQRVATVAPWLFVLFWSTGFVVARYADEDAGPLTFVSVRMLVAAVLLAAVAASTNAPRPSLVQARWSAVAGLGIHALYLGGVFLAISWGMPSGVSALIAGLHPVLTTVTGRALLGERLGRLQWLGVGIGFGGVVAVVVDHLTVSSDGLSVGALVASAVSVVGMSAGTLVQRRRGGSTPLLWGTTVQYGTTAVVLAVAALVHRDEGFRVTARSLFALAWSVGVLSIAAILIMLWLLQREAAARVSSLFFLTPALSTVEAAVLFGEDLGHLATVGLVLSLFGVALALRRPR